MKKNHIPLLNSRLVSCTHVHVDVQVCVKPLSAVSCCIAHVTSHVGVCFCSAHSQAAGGAAVTAEGCSCRAGPEAQRSAGAEPGCAGEVRDHVVIWALFLNMNLMVIMTNSQQSATWHSVVVVVLFHRNQSLCEKLIEADDMNQRVENLQRENERLKQRC